MPTEGPGCRAVVLHHWQPTEKHVGADGVPFDPRRHAAQDRSGEERVAQTSRCGPATLHQLSPGAAEPRTARIDADKGTFRPTLTFEWRDQSRKAKAVRRTMQCRRILRASLILPVPANTALAQGWPPWADDLFQDRHSWRPQPTIAIRPSQRRLGIDLTQVPLGTEATMPAHRARDYQILRQETLRRP